MRLISLTVENFRCYSTPVYIRFEDLTALVGRNDAGKSSLLDALSVYFETTKPDKDDACKSGDPKAMRITCEFDLLPDKLIIDANSPTTLFNENLLSSTQTLVIRKTYNGAIGTPSITCIEAIAEHPTASGFADLLSLKHAALLNRAAELNVDLQNVDQRVSSLVRAAIWSSVQNLKRETSHVRLDVEEGKSVWAALQPHLPTFALFKSDRASTDQDAEAQDPLKAAIREAIKSVEGELAKIQAFVEDEVRKIASATVEKLREMDASIAQSLNPIVTSKKWDTLFSTSITGDEGIPLNKRGSGVRRLVLLNFFRAKAERDALQKNAPSVIYAVEEPETSQHPRNQRLLLNALRDLSLGDGQQVIVTTHTPMLARCVDEKALRFVERRDDGTRIVSEGGAAVSDRIAKSLGVLPDHNVKVFIGVEGINDISFLKNMSRMLIDARRDVPNLEQLELDGALIFVPLGGSNLALWSNRLAHLNRPEFHLCDRDNEPPADPKYLEHMTAVNARDGCRAVATQKRELENYLHHEAIIEAYAQNGITIALPAPFADFENVPTMVAAVVHGASGQGRWEDLDNENKKRKESAAKKYLNKTGVSRMTVDRLAQTDAIGEVQDWFSHIGNMIRQAD